MPDPTSQLTIKTQGPNVTFPVKVVPGSSRTQIVGLLGPALKVKISAPPEKGKANQELTKFLSQILDLPHSAVAVTSGPTNPQKEITCQNLDPQTLIQKLRQHCPKI